MALPKRLKAGQPVPSRIVVQLAMLIAHAVRNNMENFHCEHLTDAQMAELNPLIRDAIGTTLVAFEAAGQGNEGAKEYLRFTGYIPDYWEDPILTCTMDSKHGLLSTAEDLREIGLSESSIRRRAKATTEYRPVGKIDGAVVQIGLHALAHNPQPGEQTEKEEEREITQPQE